MAYYRNSVTEKSWQLLTRLQLEFKFVLIGGWAVWVYTQQLKSKDIDVIVEFDQLEKISQRFDLYKNQRLKKYEAREREVHIDIYVPFYSNLGIPVEEIIKLSRSVSGFTVPEVEVLLILKLVAYQQRAVSAKGRKDLIDIVSLMQVRDWNWEKWHQVMELHNLKDLKVELRNLLQEIIEISELELNRHQLSKLKRGWLKNLSVYN